MRQTSTARGGAAATRLKVGVIGAGRIAQVMHLHYLRELADLFEIAVVCDVVEATAVAAAARFGIPASTTDWRRLLDEPLDAVLVLTPGSHAAVAIEAARAGLHVLVEKPMCFSTSEARAMVEAASTAGTTLMVAYNKRYDPAYERFRDEVSRFQDPRFLRVTTLESPIDPYITQYPRLPALPASPDLLAAARAADARAIDDAIGDADDGPRAVYQAVLLDTLVHEINAVRGILGEPDSLDYADLRPETVTVMLRFGKLPVAIHWIDLPGIARYRMEFALYSPDRRVTLAFPSPFLRNEPTLLEIEEGVVGSAAGSTSQLVTSYESSFKRELLAFHDHIVNGTQPPTSGADGLRDIALCQAIVECHRTGVPVPDPTTFG